MTTAYHAPMYAILIREIRGEKALEILEVVHPDIFGLI